MVSSAELSEYQDYVKKNRLADSIDDPESLQQFIRGFLYSIGVRPHLVERTVYDTKEKRIFFPYLDPLWTRAGVVSISFEEVDKSQLMTFRAKIAACIREAIKRNEADHYFHPSKGRELRERLRYLGDV